MTVVLLLEVAGLVCAGLAALGVPASRYSLLAAGVALWMLAFLLGGHL